MVNLKNIKIQIRIQIKKVQLPRLLAGKKEALQKRGGEGIWLHWMVGEEWSAEWNILPCLRSFLAYVDDDDEGDDDDDDDYVLLLLHLFHTTNPFLSLQLSEHCSSIPSPQSLHYGLRPMERGQ